MPPLSPPVAVVRRRLRVFAGALVLCASAASAQLAPGGPSGLPGEPVAASKDRPRPLLAPEGVGNQVYRLYIDGPAESACGAWTATTGTLHEAGPGLNVLYGNGNPGTSDTTLWSYTTNTGYRTGGNSGGCDQICDRDTPAIVGLFHSGVQVGWRFTWRFADGPNTIELVQEIEVVGPVDGSQNVDNTVIRETHVVRNLGPGTLRYGLRKHWDWQIGGDDGPWFATCDHVSAACDRSMNFYASGAGAGVYPPNYVINPDPESSWCPDGVTPQENSGCTGNPVYIVAGTVSPPSTLVPPPDPPEMMTFNSWTRLINNCWNPLLDDAALCGSHGSPSDDTAIAYFYGLTNATAEVLGPNEEKSFTQYVVAGDTQCPSVLEEPQVDCDSGGPYQQACSGPVATVPIQATATVTDGEPIINWTNDCGATFDDPTAEDPVLTMDVEGCSTGCGLTMTVTSTNGGDVRTCTTFVSIRDDQAPSISCPGDLTVPCTSGGARRSDSPIAAWLASVVASDACGSVTVTDDFPAFVASTGCTTTRLVRWTAQDQCGHSASCTATLTIADQGPPTVTPPADSQRDCNDPPGDRDAWRASATAQDECQGALPVSSILLSTESPCPGTTVETWQFTATDSCGHAGTATATWAVGDATPPVVTPPPAQSIECGPGAQSAEDAWLALASAVDACQGVRPIVRQLLGVTPGCAGSEIHHWRFSADDGCGNFAEATADLTIQDTTAPSIAGVPADATVACDAVPGPASPSASDACDPAPTLTFAETSAPGRCPQERTITRTWTATDACGNATTRQQRLTVVDVVAPALGGVPADETVACDAIPGPASPTALDACDPSPTITFAETSAPGRCPQERTITRTWTATDHCGNATTRQQHLTVIDVVAPTLSGVPADATVACDAIPPPASPTATDACDAAPSISFAETSSPGRCPQERTITRTWTATDACGNATTRQQHVTVIDVVAPVLSGVPADTTVACDAIPGVAAPTALDACDPSPTITFAETSSPGRCPQERTITRTWTATDACGNATTRQQRLTVVDVAAPAISGVPGDTTVACSAVPGPGSPTASDACDPAPVLTYSQARVDDPTCPDRYQLIRSWTATDACGNSATSRQTVTVADTVAPTMSGVPSGGAVSCDAIPPAPAVTASDDCDPNPAVTFNETTTPGRCPNEWTLLRQWTATDRCGNAAVRSATYSVVDTTPPLLAAPAPQVVECPAPAGAEAAWIASATATDTCGPATVQSREISRMPGCGNTYTVQREFWAVDRCGLESARVTREFRVVDTTPPALVAPGSPVIECPAPAGAEAAWIASASASDSCGTAIVQSRELSRTPGCGNTFSVQREFWAVDACGLESARVTRELRVVDTTPPSVAPPASVVVECPPAPGAEAAWIAGASATDACGAATVQSRELSRTPGCGMTYSVQREFWAVDACGLESARITREFRVVDTTPPVLVAPANAVVECPAGLTQEVAWINSASATDSCGSAMAMSREILRETGCGTTYRVQREFWAVDQCGLESGRVVREFRVVDTTPPAFSVAGDQFDVGLWPPNHGYVVFTTSSMVSATDVCGATAVRVTGCASDQPEDVHQGPADDGANGDGHFVEDCVIAADGSAFAVRAERLGACGKDSRRTYTLTFTATDECGNAATAPGRAWVGHDRSGHEPVERGRHLPPNAPPPFPYVHPTTYGTGCGS